MIGRITLGQPGRIVFGWDCINQLPELLREAGHQNLFLVCDLGVHALVQPVLTALQREGFHFEVSTDVVPEPPYAAVEHT